MKDPEHYNISASQRISQPIIVNTVFSHFTMIEFAQPWPTARKLQQPLWSLAEFFFDRISAARVVGGYEVSEAFDVFARFGSPFDTHAARVARARSLRRLEKCFSISSCVKVRPSSTDFSASRVNS